jgi:DNA (cytosine-5)-methyltransferase 1
VGFSCYILVHLGKSSFLQEPDIKDDKVRAFFVCLGEGQATQKRERKMIEANVPYKNLKVLSLFSGCGGMDLGFEGGFICHRKSINPDSGWVDSQLDEQWIRVRQTRFKTCFANDILREARLAWTHFFKQFNYDASVYHPESIVDLVKAQKAGHLIFPNEVDVVTGGFPCQDFSVAGKRNGFESWKDHNGKTRTADEPTEETRGKLYYWMKQTIDIVKPKIFVAENVKGLVTLKDVKDIIRKDFSSADGNGYIVLAPRVLHAGDYGVPENRERVFFIGIRKNELTAEARTALISDTVPEEYDPYPKPTHAYTFQGENLLPYVTCADVFKDLEEPHCSSDASQQSFSKAKYMRKHCQGQTEIKINGLGPTIRSEHHGNIEYRRLSFEHGGTNIEELKRGLQERRLSVRECALIQTFPPDYPFVWKECINGETFSLNASGGYKVIGNAVPPVLAYNIAMRLQELWSKYFGI